MANIDIVTGRNAANTRVYFTSGSTEYEIRGIDSVSASGRTRNSRDQRSFQEFPVTRRFGGWVDPDNARVSLYWNPAQKAYRELQKLWRKQTPTPFRIEQPEVEIAMGTNLRMTAAGLVTFADAKAGQDEVIFDYEGFGVGEGCIFKADSKEFVIDGFDVDGRAEVSQWPAAALAAIAADEAYTVVLPKAELRFGGFLAGDSPQFDSDSQAMTEIEIMVSGNAALYVSGQLVKEE